jgi:general secretion pathway protein I
MQHKVAIRTIPTKVKTLGFTLLEILVALAIFGLTIAPLLQNINAQQYAHKNMQEKTLAHWVALNKMNEARLLKDWPDIGTTTGEVEMRNHQWYWLQTVSKTTEKELRQIEIEVRYSEKDELPTTRFVGFIAKKS